MTAATVAGARTWSGRPLEDDGDPVPFPAYLLEHARDLGGRPVLVEAERSAAAS